MRVHHVGRLSFRVAATAVLGMVLFTTAGAAILGACINPPASQGMRYGQTLRFSFVGSAWDDVWDEGAVTARDCAVQAINAWNNANLNSNRVSFQPVESGQAPRVTFSFSNLAPPYGGGTTDPTRDSDGFVTGFGVQVTTNTNYVDQCVGITKVILHELGHGQGLADTFGSGGDSVMDQLAGKNDAGGNLPTSPTTCDVNQAYNASTDVNIICQIPPPCDYNDYQDANGCCIRPGSPIIVNLAGGSMRLTGPEVPFDLAGNGHQVAYGWTEAGTDEAFLVLDRNGDGIINDGRELFGNFTAQPLIRELNGFNALAVFDAPENGGNLDGAITTADAIFSRLHLWIDANHDGVSQPDELFSLGAKGISSISLTYEASRRRDGFGNEFRYRAKVFFDGGGVRYAWDVFLVR